MGALTIRAMNGAVVALLMLAGAAHADTIKVMNEKDRGAGSLRAAIGDAVDGDTVKVPPGEYELKTGPLTVTTDIEIEGSAQTGTIISAKGRSRVFVIDSTANPASIKKLTITGGRADLGGGVLNAGGLTLRHAIVEGNRAERGGGIANSASLRLDSSEVRENVAKADFAFGGAIHSNPAGSGAHELILVKSTVQKNVALGSTSGFGGGIFFDAVDASGQFIVDRTTIAGNRAKGTDDRGFGGGIHVSPILNNPFSIDVVIDRSTVSGNVATGPGDAFGGGIFFQPIANSGSVSLTLENSTIFGNRSVGSGAGRAFGGAGHIEPVANPPGVAPMSFSSTTITANKGVGSQVFGGALYVGIFEPPPVTSNSIIAGNMGAPSPDCTGILNSSGGNLEGSTGCGFTATNDLQNANPRFRDLAANGGPTKTAALRASSPAVDRGLSGNCPAKDQRGVNRPQGPACDSGAYELRD